MKDSTRQEKANYKEDGEQCQAQTDQHGQIEATLLTTLSAL